MTGLWRGVNVSGLATAVALLLCWELIVAVGLVDLDYLPRPSEIVAGAGEIVASGELVGNVGHTVAAALLGWVLAVIIGVPLGMLVGLVPVVRTYSMATLDWLRALPIVAFVPVAVLLFGFTIRTEIVLACYAALWPITLNTIAGTSALGDRKREVGDVLRLGPAERLWKLRLPAATPAIVVGMRLGVGLALVLALVVEMVGNPAGLGYALVQAGQALQPEVMFAYIFTIGIVGIVLNSLLTAAARLLVPGQMHAAGETA
ncbi:ABC transporter permease [Pseudonocardia kongjuensis]|uniref:ABC transporter permease n=1 Tax=Pseudonocardia kongjuensis TaxID=102227 RepID=A0ABP4IA31_9PSEU